jgi:hypothetical protein
VVWEGGAARLLPIPIWGNAPGKGQWILVALKARNRVYLEGSNSELYSAQHSFRAFSAWESELILPGPMAQAITFRALGAETKLLTPG